MASGTIDKNISGEDSGWHEITNPNVFTGTIYYRKFGPIVTVRGAFLKPVENMTENEIELGVLPEDFAPIQTVMFFGGNRRYYAAYTLILGTSEGKGTIRFCKNDNDTEWSKNTNFYINCTYFV